ncbi:hypothetical protein GmHk_09G024493 [Glycine max]|nr:hypothetical protein GmHk_09G024493 [Glycine max]
MSQLITHTYTCQVQAEASSLVDIVIYSDWRNDVLVWLPRCHGVKQTSQLSQSNMKSVMNHMQVSNYIKASFSISMIQFLMVRNQFLYMLDKDHLAPFSWLLEPCTTCRHAIIKFYFPLTFLLS